MPKNDNMFCTTCDVTRKHLSNSIETLIIEVSIVIVLMCNASKKVKHNKLNYKQDAKGEV